MRHAGTVVFLVGLLCSAATAMGAPSLVAVTGHEPESLVMLSAADVMVVREMEGYLLAVVEPDQIDLMGELGLQVEILDGAVAGKTYYTVQYRHEAQRRQLESLVRVLYSDRNSAVFEALPAAAEMVSATGLEIARVFIRPVRPAPIFQPDVTALTRGSDPVIDAIVGAISSSSIDGIVYRLQNFETRYSTHDSCLAAGEYLKAHFESSGIDSVYFHNWSGTYHDNVVAVIPGASQPEKVVVVGGHYDSTTGDPDVAPGADDNASGTACVLECARVLSPYQFDYTLKFVAFCGEEQGLLGSEAFASAAAAAGEDIVAAVAVDMIGYLAGGDVMDLDIIDNTSSVWLRDLAFATASEYVPELPLVDGSLPFGASSDHASFWANGYHAILLFEDTGDYSPYIHSASDVIGTSYNSSTLALGSVKVAASLLATLARPFTVSISHQPLGDTEDSVNPYRVEAEIVAAAALDPSSLYLYYSTGGPLNSVPPDRHRHSGCVRSVHPRPARRQFRVVLSHGGGYEWQYSRSSRNRARHRS
ncbi:MAG: M28 family peptidase [bacterium]